MYPDPLKTSALYRLIGEVEDARAEGLRIFRDAMGSRPGLSFERRLAGRSLGLREAAHDGAQAEVARQV
jgi:hypothetical protein